MLLETLYKRTRTGAIQFWSIGVINEGTTAVIVKTSGQVGGKPTQHREPVTVGKNIGRSNETTPYQQAESQAQSDWEGKRDDGYKALSELGITVIPGQNDRGSALLNILLEKLPKFNTDANGQVKPMLAPSKPFTKGKAKYPALLEPKFDGVRVTLVINGPDDLTFLSRSGKPYTTLAHLISVVRDAVLQSHIDAFPFILDGEIYYHGWTLEEINEAVKKYRPGVTEQLEFYVYDLPLHNGMQTQRSLLVDEVVFRINHPKVRYHKPIQVTSDEEVIKYHDGWVKDGYEGAMLKNPNGLYEPGQRSKFWNKVKMFDDTEFEVVGHTLGQRGVEDLMFVCKSPRAIPDYDPTFEVKLSGSRESKQRIYDEYVVPGKHIGRMFTVKHFDYTKYGIPYIPTGKTLREE
jgi:DNA ligase-1